MGRKGTGVELRAASIRVSFILNGQRVKETLSIPPTPKNEIYAAKLVADVQRAIAQGTFDYATWFPKSKRAPASAAVQTFGQACDAWLATKGRLATKTLAQYGNALEVWKTLIGAEKPVASFTHSFIAGIVGTQPWASAKLLNNYLICLRGVFKLAGRELKIENAMDGITNSKHQKPPPDPLSTAEMEMVLGDLYAKYDERVWAYFEFAFMTGMRPEELIALRWTDVDWNHGTIRVERAMSAGKVTTLKTYQTRDVDLVQRAVVALQTMKAWTFVGKPDADIFQNPVTGRSWHDERSQRDHYWKPALRRQGIRERRAYNTRHTYATNALCAGVNPSYVSRQMGHKSAKMLFEIYSKWIDGADRGREKAKMEAILSGSNIQNSSQIVPNDESVIGRRDWTRTNDPHHVKVVL
jgi:integrase